MPLQIVQVCNFIGQERESFWIRKLKTLSPNAINEKK